MHQSGTEEHALNERDTSLDGVSGLAEPNSAPARRWGTRVGLPALFIVLVLSKALFFASLLHHPVTVLILSGVVGVLTLLRGRLISTAGAGAVFFAVVLSPASLGVGIATGAGAFFAIMTLFVAIGTLLHVADTSGTRRPRQTRHG